MKKEKGKHCETRKTHRNGYRGLQQIGLLVSNDHAGIQSSLKSAFVGASWQRCKDVLDSGLEDALQFYHFEHLPFARTPSTNHLERLNREIRRRSRVVGTFPSTQSFLRLIGSYLFEYQADWATSKAFINPDHLALFQSTFLTKIAA